MTPRRHRRRAFTLIELLIVIAIIAVLIAILLPAIAQSKRSGRLAICSANMRQLHTAAGGYAADEADKIAAFSWRKHEEVRSEYANLRRENLTAGYDGQSGGLQAVGIVRRHTGRFERSDVQRKGQVYPYALYTPLVLVNYLSGILPSPVMVCPEDRIRLDWASNPRGFPEEFTLIPSDATGNHGGNDTWRRMWPYSSSYEVNPATYDYNASVVQGDASRNRAHQNFGLHRFYRLPSNHWAGSRRKFGEVRFPASKVFFNDTHQRHFGNIDLYFAYPESRQPLLFFDGSVRVSITQDSNPGWKPRDQTSPDPATFSYGPEEWEAPRRNGSWEGRDEVHGYYRWTRGGLLGVDYGHEEINTGQR